MISTKRSQFISLCNGFCENAHGKSKGQARPTSWNFKKASFIFVGIALMQCAVVDCATSPLAIADKEKERSLLQNSLGYHNTNRKLQELVSDNSTAVEAVSDQVEDHDEHDEDHDEHDEDHDAHDEDHDEHDEDHDEHDEDHDEDHDEHDEDHDEDHDEHDEDHDEHDEHDHDEHDVDHDEHDEHDHDEHDEHDHDEHDDKPWGAVIGYSLLVNLTSFIGVVAMFSCVRKNATVKKNDDLRRRFIEIAIPAFAAGALLATACLLIVPESLHQLTLGVTEHFEQLDDHDSHDGHDDHGDHDDHDRRRLDDHEGHGHGEYNVEGIINAKFGFSLIGGFFLPIILGAFFSKKSEGNNTEADSSTPQVATAVVTGEVDVEKVVDGEATAVEKVEEEPVDNKLVASIVLGDGFHNFADGIFIGIGFKLCSRQVAYAIMISTVYHELAQELADFFILTTQAGLSPAKALAFNFVSGLGILLGGLVTLANDIEADSIGAILAISAGVYFYIAGAECLPRMEKAILCAKERLLSLLFFVLGCIPIALVLLNHEHCDDH